MKKRVRSIILTIILVFCLLPMTALAATSTEIKIQADKTEVHPGDTITYTITFGLVQNLQGAEFKISIPEGLSYVENSGNAVEGLADLLGAEKAEFTETSKKFIAGGAGSYTGVGITNIMSFQCTVDEGATGDLMIGLTDVELSDNNYDVIPHTVNSDASKVTIMSRPVAVTGVSLNKTELSLNIGDTETLTATVVPGDAMNKKVSFSSNNEAVATVDASTGVVTAMEEGKAVIMVETEEGGKIASCEVTVSCGHAVKTRTEAKESSCVDKGWDAYFTCNRCNRLFKEDGLTRIDEIPYRELIAHSYTEQDMTEEHLKTAGSCNIEAIYYKSCVGCGANGTDTFIGATDADNHVNITRVNQRGATCGENGYSGDIKCTDCERIITNGFVVIATGHKDDNNDNKCDICGYQLSVITTNPTVNTAGNATNISTSETDPSGTQGEIVQSPKTGEDGIVFLVVCVILVVGVVMVVISGYNKKNKVET
uniref:Ig-like domain-containing protein n=1 Tax=Acetatifactor sp. TaxID=1872090 RepID=UPI00405620E6